ncbi:MAG: PilC/PilY family type IV pilus protein [bacterium]|nr:PilC/PilY family type IV pilus protein [bacterium]
MKKLAFFVIFLCLAAKAFSADDLFSITVEPDVLLIFDTSGSMTYDMNGNCTWGDGSDYFPGRDTNGDGFSNDSRMYILKNAVYNVVYKHRNIRFGLLTYGQYKSINELSRGASDGGGWYRTSPYTASKTQKIPWHGVDGSGNDYWPKSYPEATKTILRAPMGLAGDAAHIGQIHQWLDNAQQVEEIRADGGTPIGGSFYWARQYYTQALIPKDPAKRCRGYYVLLCSDGEETGYPGNNPYSPYTEATRLRGIQIMGVNYDVKTFACGVAVAGGNGAKCLDSIAKLGGTEHYYPATSPEMLDSVLNTIFSLMEERATSFSGPEVPSVRTEYYNNIYIASFMPSGAAPFWDGYIKAFRLNPDGTLPQDDSGHVLSSPLWEAGEALKNMTSSERNIYTQKSNNRIAFTPSYVDSNDLGVAGDSVEDLINYVRGDNGYDWKLGDIFHSWPVCVGPPSPWYTDEGYEGFKAVNKHRRKIVIDGANDGMLHAFDAGTYVAQGDTFTPGTGRELWAFIPKNQLSKLKNLRIVHNYYVDGNPIVFDTWIPSSMGDTTKDSTEWKTELICGERSGGSYYFGLDVTNTENPSFLWEIGGDTMFAQTWSNPAIGRVRVGTGEKTIAVIGGGFNKESGTLGRAVYVIDAKDGTVLKKFTNTYMTYCIPSDPVLVDTSNDGFSDYIYIGDIAGQLWKFDIRSLLPASWSGSRIFVSQREQPFYYPPSCAYDADGNLWLFFGGGDRDSLRKVNTFNRFYGIRDNRQTTPYTDGDLVNITGSGTPNSNGWYRDLGKNEKSVSKPIVFNETVYFTTYEPIDPTNPCGIEGLARLYHINFTTGKAPDDDDVSEEIGEGVPMSPQISVTVNGEFVITIGGSKGELISEKVKGPSDFKKIIFWKEQKNY